MKITGIAGAATVLASGCGRRNDEVTTEVPKGQMTYRNLNGDRISLLGYGCMRWPQKAAAEGENSEIDQERVNALVDYAIEHGINYFDTAPTYLRGFSEDATGIALKRYRHSPQAIPERFILHRHEAVQLRRFQPRRLDGHVPPVIH